MVVKAQYPIWTIVDCIIFVGMLYLPLLATMNP
jgi:hypothetical protein